MPGAVQRLQTPQRPSDALRESTPSFLANSTVPIANQDFADAKTEATLRELHAYLVQKHNLLTRVIAARKTHHVHFYFESHDYGRQHYLDNLQNQKYIVTRALERLERRTAEVLIRGGLRCIYGGVSSMLIWRR